MVTCGSIPFQNTYEKHSIIREIKKMFNYQVKIEVTGNNVFYQHYEAKKESVNLF